MKNSDRSEKVLQHKLSIVVVILHLKITLLQIFS